MIWNTKEKYIGNWKQDIIVGKGTLYYPDGKIKEIENWYT